MLQHNQKVIRLDKYDLFNPVLLERVGACVAEIMAADENDLYIFVYQDKSASGPSQIIV